jgi:hypothetical protein
MRPVDNTRAALDQAYEHALDWPDGSRSATRMPGLAAPAGSFFGFVIGGTVPAALAADWLTAVWDQNAAFAMLARPRGPLGRGRSMAIRPLGDATHRLCGLCNWRCHGELPGWPRPAMGCLPRLAGMSRLGSGAGIGATDQHGRIQPDDLAAALRRVSGPVIVCLQAGNVNTGSCDPFRPAIQAATDRARAGGVPADSAGSIECGDRTRVLHQRHHCEDPHHAHLDEAQSPRPCPSGRARVRDGTLRLPLNDHMGSVDRFRVARAVLLRRLNVYSTSMASPLPLPPFGGLHGALFHCPPIIYLILVV